MLSKLLSNEDTPLIDALGIVLKALGYQLSIAPVENENSNLEAGTLQTAHVAEGPTAGTIKIDFSENLLYNKSRKLNQ